MKFLIGSVAIVLTGVGIMFWIHNSQGNNADKSPNSLAEESETFPDGSEVGTQFGSDRVKDGQAAKPVAFDGNRAMTYLRAICDLGPRISGSRAMRLQQDLIKKHFESLGAKVAFQSFEAQQTSVKGKVEMTNIIVSFYPEKKRRVILCSHYDTRPIADQEPDPRNWKKDFVSANDGGSGVALLMEMGNHMKDLKTHVGVDFVIFDGEEYIFQTEGFNRDRYFIGSQHFAKTWKADKSRCDYSAAILLDMIAGKRIEFPLESHSWNRCSNLCREVWTIAAEQKASAFRPFVKHAVLDDHIELQKVGIPAIDIIDFDYPHWHRLSDTPNNCSADSFAQVARVLSVWLQRTK